MQTILHYLTMPVKILLISAITLSHNVGDRIRYRFRDPGIKKPDRLRLLRDYNILLESVYQDLKTIPGASYPYYIIPKEDGENSDHQALRHGSLAWATRDEKIINGLTNFITEERDFARGIKLREPLIYNLSRVPPSMPMSVSFGIAVALRNHVPLDTHFRLKFVSAVRQLADRDFKIYESSLAPKASSTAFDLIYVHSLLWSAYRLTNDEAFKKIIDRSALTHGALLLAPLTYPFRSRRNYHIDHIFLFGAWTCIELSDDGKLKSLYKHAMKFVYDQSSMFTNPYFAALAFESGVLGAEDRDLVLRAHGRADLMLAATNPKVEHRKEVPCDWSRDSGDEFKFDGSPQGQAVQTGQQNNMLVSLNGLTLGQSLLTLLDD